MKRLKIYLYTAAACKAFLNREVDLAYPPVRLWIEITGICNLKCAMCPQSKRKNIDHMSFDLFKNIINEASPFVYDIKLNVGGEPTLHPQHDKFISYARKKDIKVEMHTNATVLTEEKSQKILESRLNVISFSLDTFDSEKYPKSRVGGNFHKTINNIKNFLILKQKGNYKVPYTIIQLIQFPDDTRKNKLIEKIQIEKFYRGLPLDEIKIIKMHNFGGKIDRVKYNKYRYHACGDIYHAMNIKWNGKVVPCCLDLLDELELGDINKNGLLEIWKSRQYNDLRKALAEGCSYSVPLCSNCENAYCKLPFKIPNNLIGLARSVIGRNRVIGFIENQARKIFLLR